MSPAADSALPKWWVAMWVAFPASLGAFSGAYKRTFDAWVHIFFADHYLRGWFETYEPRWYGGFSVLTYPPLTHQTVSTAGRILGVEWGFVAVMFGTMLALPFAARAFSRQLIGPQYDGWVLVLMALWPTSHRFAYVYGQLPTLFATVFALFAMAALCRFLDSGKFSELFQFVACVGATAAAHHVTTIFVVAGCAIVSVDRLVRSDAGSRKRTILRGVLAAGLAGVAIVSALYPFLRFASQSPQEEIPHISRDPIWKRPFGIEVVEQVALVGIGLVALVLSAFRSRRSLGLSFGALFFGILSLGFTTPLPKILFGAQARWLTYDKFHHWAAIWCVVLLAIAAAKVGKRAAIPIAVLLLPVTLLNVGHKQSDALQPEFIKDISAMVGVLKGPQAHQYRHLTLGFGDQLCRLSIYGDSPNIDGDYHTARSDPVLRASGVGTVDASKYYDKGKAVLDHVLQNADETSLRWVFVNDGWYFDSVLAAGFELREVWENGVTLFEKADVPPIAAKPIDSIPAGKYWGTVPPLMFILVMASVLVKLVIWFRAGGRLQFS